TLAARAILVALATLTVLVAVPALAILVALAAVTAISAVAAISTIPAVLAATLAAARVDGAQFATLVLGEFDFPIGEGLAIGADIDLRLVRGAATPAMGGGVVVRCAVVGLGVVGLGVVARASGTAATPAGGGRRGLGAGAGLVQNLVHERGL
ncbi:MAG: hypothetical protein ACKOQ7_11590, partial [Actinomycetota bacterium]